MNEPDGRIGAIAPGLLGWADKEEGLEDAEGGGADGPDLKDPPGAGHDKEVAS